MQREHPFSRENGNLDFYVKKGVLSALLSVSVFTCVVPVFDENGGVKNLDTPALFAPISAPHFEKLSVSRRRSLDLSAPISA